MSTSGLNFTPYSKKNFVLFVCFIVDVDNIAVTNSKAIVIQSILEMSTESDRLRKNLASGEVPGEVLGSSVMAEANQSDVYSLELMKDFPPGPLDHYRQKASFDWKKMKLFLEGEDILRFKVRALSLIMKLTFPNTTSQVWAQVMLHI